jgi:hypothetical protein
LGDLFPPSPIVVLNLLKVVAYALLYAVALWSLVIVLNFKKKSAEFKFFPRISLMAYAWQAGKVIERKNIDTD